MDKFTNTLVVDCEQGTDEWFSARLGVATASKFKDVMAKGAGKTRKSYLIQLAAEMLTNEKADSYSNSAMEWGTATEPQARDAYQFMSDNEAVEVGFCKISDHVGASPDSLVGDNGLLEIKCPNTTTQIITVLDGKVPTTHKAQIQGQLFVTQREWCDFVSFDPRIQGDASYFCQRVERDEIYIASLERELDAFVEELHETITELKGVAA